MSKVTGTPLKLGLAILAPESYPHDRSKVRLVLKGTAEGFEDVRCSGCHTLLYRIKGRLHKSQETQIEVKCRKCGNVNLG